MTSAHKTLWNNKKKQAGFTLLEIIITLSIIAIMMGSAFFAFSSNRSTAINNTQGEIEALGSQALRRSVSLGRPHYAIIRHDAIWVTELIDENEDLSRMEPESGIALVKIPPEVTLSCKREDSDWLIMTDRTDPVVWVFARSGICETFSFRLEDEGGATYEMTVNPITGNFIDLDEEADQ